MRRRNATDCAVHTALISARAMSPTNGGEVMTIRGRWRAVLAVTMLAATFIRTAAWAAEDKPDFPPEQIEQMVAPIALYPDPLVTTILMASTYPLEVVQADRWLKANPKVTGAALDEALKKQPWDDSV